MAHIAARGARMELSERQYYPHQDPKRYLPGRDKEYYCQRLSEDSARLFNKDTIDLTLLRVVSENPGESLCTWHFS